MLTHALLANPIEALKAIRETKFLFLNESDTPADHQAHYLDLLTRQ